MILSFITKYALSLGLVYLMSTWFKAGMTTTALTVKTVSHTTKLGIEAASEYLDAYQKLKFTFSFPGPLMVYASTGPREHQSRAQRGLIRYEDGGDDDGEGNGDHSASLENRNEPAHQGKSGWEERLLEKHRELDERLKDLEARAHDKTS